MCLPKVSYHKQDSYVRAQSEWEMVKRTPWSHIDQIEDGISSQQHEKNNLHKKNVNDKSTPQNSQSYS
jgi:hypothetical protein